MVFQATDLKATILEKTKQDKHLQLKENHEPENLKFHPDTRRMRLTKKPEITKTTLTARPS